jgi:SAM-dependent methyltransferase
VEEVKACDLCGMSESAVFIALPDQPPFGLVCCSNCALVYVDPRPSPEEIGHYYGEQYYMSRSPQIDTSRQIFQKAKGLAYRAQCLRATEVNPSMRVGLSMVNFATGWRVRRRLPPLATGRLLDVGCGNGTWIGWIQDNIPGWEVEGVEINPHAAQAARTAFGLEVHVGNLQDLYLPPDQYDLITFWHSLEHVHSPSAVVHEAHRLLRRGGWLGIEVPNINSFEAQLTGDSWYHLDVPRHLFHFSQATLVRLLTQNGFKVLSAHPIRGNVGLVAALGAGRLNSPAPLRPILRAAFQTVGRLSPWGMRVYAEKV